MAAIEVTEATFDTHVLQADLPVLVDFQGDDCVKCQAQTNSPERCRS